MINGELKVDSEPVPFKVFYDGACPRCRRDRDRYQRLAGQRAHRVQWVDVTTHADALHSRGVRLEDALRTLHVEDGQGRLHHGLDAYILLMRVVPVLRPLAWLLGLPVINPVLARLYRWSVRRRLARQGRLPR